MIVFTWRWFNVAEIYRSAMLSPLPVLRAHVLWRQACSSLRARPSFQSCRHRARQSRGHLSVTHESRQLQWRNPCRDAETRVCMAHQLAVDRDDRPNHAQHARSIGAFGLIGGSGSSTSPTCKPASSAARRPHWQRRVPTPGMAKGSRRPALRPRRRSGTCPDHRRRQGTSGCAR